MSGSVLAFAYLPPPANGGTAAGDVFFNTSQSWQINGKTYDLMTVAIHEFGHALGMGHSTVTTAAMYAAYNGTKQALTTDDISGIRSIYSARQKDFFDAQGSNDTVSQADDISSYLDGNGQLTISALDITTPPTIGQGDIDWYKITVPSTTTGTMVVKMQSAQLSLLAPNLAVFNSAGTKILGQQYSSNLGDTVSVTINNVSAGQVYAIRCKGNNTGDSGFGAYGLQVNVGSLTQPPVAPPNTVVAQATDQGGGTINETTGGSVGGGGLPRGAMAIPNTTSPNVLTVGDVSGPGDAMMVDVSAEANLELHGPGSVPPWTPLWQPPPPITVFTPTVGTIQGNQNGLTTLDFLFGSGQTNPILPTAAKASSRGVEKAQYAVIDRSLEDWRSDSLA
jgi:hypothetical protein